MGGQELLLTNGETGYTCGVPGGNPQLFESNPHIVSVDDQAGVIVAVADACFFGMDAACNNVVSILESFSSATLLSVGDNSFYGCTSLTSMAAGITTVGIGAFYGCTSLTSVSTNITTIGDLAFGNCNSLTSISIPSCTTLGATAGDDMVFIGIAGATIAVTCDASLLSAQGPGIPDGDLCYLHDNNTITVNGAPLTGCP